MHGNIILFGGESSIDDRSVFFLEKESGLYQQSTRGSPPPVPFPRRSNTTTLCINKCICARRDRHPTTVNLAPGTYFPKRFTSIIVADVVVVVVVWSEECGARRLVYLCLAHSFSIYSILACLDYYIHT